jgi:uncharacterized protein YegJ (DUF2314 family)
MVELCLTDRTSSRKIGVLRLWRASFFLGALLFFIPCAPWGRVFVTLAEAKEASAPGEPPCFRVSPHYKRMREAVRRAQASLPVFLAALRHPSPNQKDFAVKKVFIQGEEVEHIWLSDVRWKKGKIYGRIDNRPLRIGGLKLGQWVSASPSEISDWMFLDHGKLVGGYTLQACSRALPRSERKKLWSAADFRVQEP